MVPSPSAAASSAFPRFVKLPVGCDPRAGVAASTPSLRTAPRLLAARQHMEGHRWGDARRLLEDLLPHAATLACTPAGRQQLAAIQVALGECHRHAGHPHRALALGQEALLQVPDDHAAERLRLSMVRKIERLGGYWRTPLQVSGQPLHLEPLDLDHADDFLWQYRDPVIQQMTRLPPFADHGDWLDWVQGQLQRPQRWRYAVMHEEWGLVAYVSLHPLGRAASFGFWSGTDHRGRGWASIAGSRLIRHVQTLGIDWIFAVAFARNRASLRALGRMGFQRLPARSREVEEGGPREYLVLTPAGGIEMGPAMDAFLAFMQRDDPMRRFDRC